MWTKDIGKVYPELKGLPPYEQNIILERARHEIKEEGKNFFWGAKLALVAVLIAVVIFTALYFTVGVSSRQAPFIGLIIGFIVYMFANNHNIKLLQLKVRELVHKENI